jgi:hypothetical protein
MGRCCHEYSFTAHSAADPSTGGLLACPDSRWQASRNRLDRAGKLKQSQRRFASLERPPAVLCRLTGAPGESFMDPHPPHCLRELERRR